MNANNIFSHPAFKFLAELDELDNSDNEPQEPALCNNCGGSGEGRYEGYTCVVCRGRGEV